MLDLQGYGHLLLSGTYMTMKLALTSLLFGMIFALLGATAKLSSIKFFRMLGTLYTALMRGIPEMLLVLFLYYGGTMILSALLNYFGYAGRADISAFWAGVMALSIAFGAYGTEVLRMAIQEVPKGQWEAAQAVGMKPAQTFFRIILPQVWTLALPGLGNLFLVLMKDTALVSVIGLKEITYYASRAGQTTQEPFTFFLAAAILYLALSIIATGIMMWLEWRANPAKRYAQSLKKKLTLIPSANAAISSK